METESVQQIVLEDILIQTKYYRDCVENLLAKLQPAFYCLDLIVKVLLHGPDGSGKRTLAKLAAQKLNMKFCSEYICDLFDENIVGTEKKIRASIEKLVSSAPCLVYMSGYELLTYLDDIDLDRIEYCIRDELDKVKNHQPVIFIAATNDRERVYRSILSNIFHHDISMKPMTLSQANETIESLHKQSEMKCKLTKCLNKLADSSLSQEEYHLGNIIKILAQTDMDANSIGPEQDSLENLGSSIQDTSKTCWSDVGGLGHVKNEIIDAIQLSLDYPQLKKSGLRRTGVLMYGPPGTGKTLLARAVANECNMSFINVKGPELLNEYVGQSEMNIRKLFARARDTSPCVIFFDELDSLAPNRGQTGDSGGVMDRLVSQILAEMDGIGKNYDVFVIGATNRVDLVDPSLLRPGRFDKIIEVPLPASKESRVEILRALTRKMQLEDDVKLDEIESKLRPQMSGADLGGFCSRAMQRAFDRCIERVESGAVSEHEVNQIDVSMDDFVSSLGDDRRQSLGDVASTQMVAGIGCE